MKYYPLGDSGCIVQIDNHISEESNSKAISFSDYLLKQNYPSIIDVVPTYCDVIIYYDPYISDYAEISRIVELAYNYISCEKIKHKNRKIKIPVLYDYEFGLNLKELESQLALSKDQIIHLHSSKIYHTYMIGYVPGFPYLGQLNSLLKSKKRGTPNLKAPIGSVAIAGLQTGIYPVSCDTSWNIIGKTPVRLFNPLDNENPTVIQPGDLIEFYPVDKTSYYNIESKVYEENYILEIENIVT